MLFALGAASTAIDALKALTSTKPPSGANKDAQNLFAFSADASASTGTGSSSGSGKTASISAETMSALLAAQSQSGLDASASMRPGSLKEWFAKVDSDKDGKISKSEFEALGAGDDGSDPFSKLDKNGDGSVNLGELVAALRGKGHRHRAENSSGDPSQSDPLMQALDNSLSTSAAKASASGAATSSYNFMDQLIQRQSSLVSAQASSSLSVSV